MFTSTFVIENYTSAVFTTMVHSRRRCSSTHSYLKLYSYCCSLCGGEECRVEVSRRSGRVGLYCHCESVIELTFMEGLYTLLHNVYTMSTLLYNHNVLKEEKEGKKNSADHF